jgi:hypothetical protein
MPAVRATLPYAAGPGALEEEDIAFVPMKLTGNFAHG